MMRVNEHGLYAEPTYIQGGYKQSLRDGVDPWGYGAGASQPGTYQLGPGGMAPYSTLGGYGEVVPGLMLGGGGLVYGAVGVALLWASWRIISQGWGGPKAGKLATAVVGGLAASTGASMVLGGGLLTASGAVLAAR